MNVAQQAESYDIYFQATDAISGSQDATLKLQWPKTATASMRKRSVLFCFVCLFVCFSLLGFQESGKGFVPVENKYNRFYHFKPRASGRLQTSYIVLDLGSDVNAEVITSAAAKSGGYSLVGLDTPTPYLQIGPLIFRGEFDETIGTDLLFSQTEERRPTANASGTLPHRRRTVTYMGQTTKTIKFTKVKLNRKTGEAGGREEEERGGRATAEGEGEKMEGLEEK
ncbi:hypothetical protein BC937DRAFT_95133 [Endogone sp. FLAS-F59071]|nr:hypothetical protein BC937DRAFT_95133 [Endogone sp. FLAS-F59071]|eukprot:RUS13561.1 hypothetical protein BC937DRAFT_95133 [Endogone sp. FLAS-F59071]